MRRSGIQLAKKNRENPWKMLGGSLKGLNAELHMGLFELQGKNAEKIWGSKENIDRAVKMGGVIEEYGRATLAPIERCRLWERFRKDMENRIKIVMKDPNARVLMMGGVAQGMATVDGDVDLSIFLPSHIKKLGSERAYVRSTLHLIGRDLRQHGFDGFVVPARVPIIQYRPNPDIEKLYSYEGADKIFRLLTFKTEVTEAEAEKIVQNLTDFLQVPINLHDSEAFGLVMEFPQAADAYAAMFHHHKKFSFPAVTPGTGKSRMAEAIFSKMNPPANHGSKTAEQSTPQPVKKQGIVTIDDILKTASKGTPISSGAFTPYPFSVDISVSITEHPWGPRNSELLRRYLSADTRVRTLAMFVKWWSKHSTPVAINNSRSGWLTSYCVLAMLIHFLIQEKRLEFIDPATINPVLEADTRYPENRLLTDADKLQLVRDFMKFCEYYATGFDYKTNVISLVTGKVKTREECTSKVMSARNTDIIIEDPYEDRSLGHPIDANMLLKIRATFLAGAKSCVSNITAEKPDVALSRFAKELKAKGPQIFKQYYNLKPSADGGGCSLCAVEKVAKGSKHNACKKCENALQAAKQPLEFFSMRSGEQAEIEAEVHIREQKKQERALREQQFLERNHKRGRRLKN
eukprot:TRINITY_DN953_c3_g1_i1.p1 TRINITY_DN953_c3_g1~~TRINITY_DN953_c3_g1_i1.p1  ORF type:complete len:645 (+),score=111.91 TRINITY_DN953_c3_g1_i1:41-1936(+)